MDDLSEADEIELALRNAKRGEGVSEAMHRAQITAGIRRQRAQRQHDQAQSAEIQRLIDQAAKDGIPMTWAVAAKAVRRQQEDAERDRLDHAQRAARIYAEQQARRPKPTPIPRPPGRKRGSRTVGKVQIVATFRELAERLRRTPTQGELAANLQPKIALRTLQDMLTEYGLPWPIE